MLTSGRLAAAAGGKGKWAGDSGIKAAHLAECPYARDICFEQQPDLVSVDPNNPDAQKSACLFAQGCHYPVLAD